MQPMRAHFWESCSINYAAIAFQDQTTHVFHLYDILFFKAEYNQGYTQYEKLVHMATYTIKWVFLFSCF